MRRARHALGLMLLIGLSAAVTPVSAQLTYVGSSTIGENIVPAAAEAFAAKTGIRFGEVQSQGSGRGLDLVLKGSAPLAGVSRPLSLAEKQRRIYYQIIGYDAALAIRAGIAAEDFGKAREIADSTVAAVQRWGERPDPNGRASKSSSAEGVLDPDPLRSTEDRYGKSYRSLCAE